MSFSPYDIEFKKPQFAKKRKCYIKAVNILFSFYCCDQPFFKIKKKKDLEYFSVQNIYENLERKSIKSS